MEILYCFQIPGGQNQTVDKYVTNKENARVHPINPKKYDQPVP